MHRCDSSCIDFCHFSKKILTKIFACCDDPRKLNKSFPNCCQTHLEVVLKSRRGTAISKQLEAIKQLRLWTNGLLSGGIKIFSKKWRCISADCQQSICKITSNSKNSLKLQIMVGGPTSLSEQQGVHEPNHIG